MDLRYSAAEEQFRAELRTWLEHHPPGPEPEQLDAWVAYGKAWQRRLYEAGWCGVAWPAAYGGRGATLIEQVIFQEEMARARAPMLINLAGLTMGGPVLIAHGTEQQKHRYLQKILSAEEIWCQGFSEPNAGSDLAALQTKAVLDGDSFIVTGQKVWTSFARYADWCMLLVRTDPAAAKHRGITFLHRRHAQPGHHRAAAEADQRRRRLQRAVLRRCPGPARQRRRRDQQRLGHRHHDAHARTRHADVQPPAAVAHGACRPAGLRPALAAQRTAGDGRPARPPAPGAVVHRKRGDQVHRLPQPDQDVARRRAGAGRVDGEALLERDSTSACSKGR